MSATAYISERLGTDRWVVAPRLTPRLKAKGYTLAVRGSRLREIEVEYFRANGRCPHCGGKLDGSPE